MWYKNNYIYKTHSEVRLSMPNTSMPEILTDDIIVELGFVKVKQTEKPSVNDLQTVHEDGVETDIDGNIMLKWVVRDMFSDYTNEDGVVVTKLSQETEYIAKKQADSLNKAKAEMMIAIESLIQGEIDKYNEANMVAFKDIDACAKYTTVPTYTHYQFCVDVIAWQTSVWEYARQVQADVLAGTRTMPTVEELLAELPTLEV